MINLSIFDIFKYNSFKKEIETLNIELDNLKNKRYSLDKMNAIEVENHVAKLENKINESNSILEKNKIKLEEIHNSILSHTEILSNLKSNILSVHDDLNMESHGLYVPRYDFATSLVFKDELTNIRNKQKTMIKNKNATNHFSGWTVNGSASEGQKMTNNAIKQILRSFNNECEASINKVKYNNIERIENRIKKSYEQLNKINEVNKVSISNPYLKLKLEELYLAFEYENKKQEEKELLREEREREKEEKALQKEIEKKQSSINKDLEHYNNMLQELEQKRDVDITESELNSLNEEIQTILNKIKEKEDEKNDLDYRNKHASAGYVYIISNIGAFGEDVLKIGVTRRLEPLDRISELSSASVPFKFDIHALIFSYDAYSLENELHQYFDKYRINKVNYRKEFFKVPIKEVETKLKEYGHLTIDFISTPDADEFRQSQNKS